jgi:hypothetical protein
MTRRDLGDWMNVSDPTVTQLNNYPYGPGMSDVRKPNYLMGNAVWPRDGLRGSTESCTCDLMGVPCSEPGMMLAIAASLMPD